MIISISIEDSGPIDYLQDHHNRENEVLIPITHDEPNQIIADIIEQCSICGIEGSEVDIAAEQFISSNHSLISDLLHLFDTVWILVVKQ